MKEIYQCNENQLYTQTILYLTGSIEGGVDTPSNLAPFLYPCLS